MHVRKYVTAADLTLDASPYLTRDDVLHELRLDIPPAVTAALPESLTYDVWLGVNYLTGGAFRVERAVTR